MTMLTLAQALDALAHLLDAVGEQGWRAYIQEDLQAWLDWHDTDGLLHRYGGMGSLTDLIVCQANGHRLTLEQEPWANYQLNWLVSVCYDLAKPGPHAISLAEIEQVVEKNDLVRRALLRQRVSRIFGRRRTAIAGNGAPLQGWRCLDCGYATVGPQDVDDFLAPVLAPPLLIEGCRQGDLPAQVDAILNLRIPLLAQAREAVRAALLRGGIVLRTSRGWLRPCPNCGSTRTAVYRWNVRVDGGLSFVPAANNLPLAR